jgi:hypothetical protein
LFLRAPRGTRARIAALRSMDTGTSFHKSLALPARPSPSERSKSRH